MAHQVKFYSVAANADKTDNNGIYFVTGGELYKGTSRFGANKVTTQATPPTAAQGAISGDINIYNNITKVFDGSEWKNIVDITGLGLSLKASVGDSATTAQHGISAAVSLYSNAEPTIDMTVGAVTTAAGITSTSDYFTTGSAVYNKVIGLSVGGTGSYIEYVDVDGNGKLQAHAKTFPAYTATEVTKTGTSNGHTVSVTTKNGQVTAVSLTAPSWDDIGSATKSSTSGGITASVTTEAGKVTSVSLNAENINCSTVTAGTATFDNLTVNTSAAFTATTVSASTLTVGGNPVNNIANTSAYGTDSAAGITVSVTTSGGGVTAVSVDGPEIVKSTTGIAATSGAASDDKVASEKAIRKAIDDKFAGLDSAMHFKGVVTSLPTTSNVQGDIVVVGANPTGYITSAGVGTTTSTNNKKLVQGQEYIYDGSKWELIGDQSAVTGGTSTSTSNGFTATVVTAAATAAPTVTLTAPSYIATASSITGTSNDHSVTVSTENGRVTGVVVAAPSRFSASEIGQSSATSTSNNHSVTVKTSAGKVTEVIVAAPSRFTVGEIGSSSLSDTDKGITVSVATTNGKVTTVDVTTTLSTTLGADENHAPTVSAVYEALCWHNASGGVIA